MPLRGRQRTPYNNNAGALTIFLKSGWADFLGNRARKKDPFDGRAALAICPPELAHKLPSRG
jgi:hypothetical protein